MLYSRRASGALAAFTALLSAANVVLGAPPPAPAANSPDALSAPPSSAAEEKPPPPGSPPPGETSMAERRAAAAAHYQKGLALIRREAWDAALAEFLEARALYPSRTATASAAATLRNLGRWDEALDMFEALLREFDKTLPPETKAAAQREIVELRALVGTIEIEGARPGAAISIDRQDRGEYPSLAPLRVVAGSHVVRVYKEGFEPFERLVDVAGGKSVVVNAALPALLRSGRLKVAEQEGRELDVLVDGGVVGKTPFEGPFAPGEHVVVLRGEGDLGTPPTPISVELNGTASLTLLADNLSAELRIAPTPANALIAIDSVSVGRGIWEGRLRAGKHRIEIASPGFTTLIKEIVLEGDRRTVLPLELVRDPTSPFWYVEPRRARFTFEIGGAFSVGSSLDDADSSCVEACSRGLGLGGFGAVRAGYELGSRIGFGVSLGYFGARQGTTDRKSSITPVGLAYPNIGLSDETTAISGFLGGAWGGMSFFEGSPIRARVNAGFLLGTVSSTRSGSFEARAGMYEVGPVAEIHGVSFFVLSPELRIGLPLGRGIEISAGIEAPTLFALTRPKWDPTHAVYAGSDGYGTFPAAFMTSTTITFISPAVGLRYEL
jgi:hypothetical protein